MHIAFCYNIKRNLPSTDPEAQADAEFDAPETIAAIRKALETGGHTVIEIEANQEAYLKLYEHRKKIDIVYTIAEGYYGSIREAQISAFCDMLQIPYSYSCALTHAISLDKALTKKVLLYQGIKTPAFQMFQTAKDKLRRGMRFPIILKPNAEGSSKGILDKNLVKNEKELRERVGWLLKSFHEPVLIEEFLPGREVTVAVLGNDPPKVLPIIEQRYDMLPKEYSNFASYEVKWLWEDRLKDLSEAFHCPAPLTPTLKNKIEQICLATYKALNCYDVARIDLRLDKRGEPHILEINTLPGMIPGHVISYLPIAMRTAGYDYNAMVLAILDTAVARLKKSGTMK